jgi:hypothetical protein
VGLLRGPLSLVRITEELLERKVAAPVYKTEINGSGDLLRWPRDTLYPLKLALSSQTSGGRLVGIVHWRTKAPYFFWHYSDVRIIFINWAVKYLQWCGTDTSSGSTSCTYFQLVCEHLHVWIAGYREQSIHFCEHYGTEALRILIRFVYAIDSKNTAI